jgi:hypothetical protein
MWGEGSVAMEKKKKSPERAEIIEDFILNFDINLKIQTENGRKYEIIEIIRTCNRIKKCFWRNHIILKKQHLINVATADED